MNTDSPILCLTFFFALWLVSSIVSISRDKKDKSSWNAKAFSRKNLTYTPARWLESGYLAGIYRGYHVRIGTFSVFPAKTYQVYTYIKISSDHQPKHVVKDKDKFSEKSVSPDDIMRMLIKTRSNYVLDKLYRGDKLLKAKPDGKEILYQQRYIIKNTHDLLSLLDLLCYIADSYNNVVGLGEKAKPALKSISGSKEHFLQEIAVQILKDINKREREGS